MRFSRRQVLQAGTSALLLSATTHTSLADMFPTRPVRVIVPFGPGGPVDVLGRLVAQKFSDHFGQQFFVENLAGAGGNIGTEKAARAAPDGYTILINANNHVINPLLYETVPYDPFKDFAPVSLAVGFPTALSVNNAVAAHERQRIGCVDLFDARQIQLCIAGRGNAIPPPRRAVQTEAEPRYCACALQRQRSSDGSCAGGRYPGLLCGAYGRGAFGEKRLLARPCDHEPEAVTGVAGRAEHRRKRLSRSRRRRLGRHTRSRWNAAADRYAAQRANSRCSRLAGRCATDCGTRFYIGGLNGR